MKIGYKLTAEAFGPKELIRQAVLAEQAGFDFVEMSDHYHPWLEAQGHSPFTWSVLPAIAAETERIGLVTGVTCPSVRYHPAIIAQAAATLAIISDGRFTLGAGAGERLNEHVVGTGFPARRVRHERFVDHRRRRARPAPQRGTSDQSYRRESDDRRRARSGRRPRSRTACTRQELRRRGCHRGRARRVAVE